MNKSRWLVGWADLTRSGNPIVWLSCGVLLVATTLVATSPAQAQLLRPDEYDKRDRRVAIQPKKPAKGIKGGLVIAYGHPLRPPYSVEVRGEKIFVNAIQVLPSILDEKYWASLPKPTQDDREKAISESLWRGGNEIQEMARKGESHEKIFEFAKRQPYMNNVRWESRGVLEYTLPNGQGSSIELPQSGEVRINEAEIKRRSMAATRARVKQIESILRKGHCIIFVDSGISEQLVRESFPSAVPKIMDDVALSADEKTGRLRELLGVESIVADVMANYVSEEWTLRP